MNIEHLKYGKAAPTRKVKPVPLKVISPNQNAALLPASTLPSNYTKQEGKLDVRIIFILSGGEDRERNYFKMIKDDHKIKNVQIAFASKKGQGLSPTQLFEAAIKCTNEKRFPTEETSYAFHPEVGDIVYLLQDIDEFEPQIQQLEGIKRPACIHWIYSNPAFEIWLYYHECSSPLPQLQEATNKTTAERSLWLKRNLPRFLKGGVKTTKAIVNIRKAIANSKANYQERGPIPTLFSTQMHILAEDLLDSMGEEFDQMVERKARFNQAMKEKYSTPITKNIRYEGEKINEFIKNLANWAEEHPLCLPKPQSGYNKKSYIIDDKAFQQSYKIAKKNLDDNYNTAVGNLEDLYLDNIQRDIYHYYLIAFLLNQPIKSYVVDFSEIKEVIAKLGLNEQYAMISTFRLSTFDSIYGGVPIKETEWGYDFNNIPIYFVPSNINQRCIFIMRRENLPTASLKQFSGNNPEFELIDEKSLLFSNIHKMKDLGNNYGLSVMRVVRFIMPKKENFKFIKLDIVDYSKNKSQIKEVTTQASDAL